MTQVNSFLLL